MTSGIYAIIHRDSGRWYVGQSKSIEKRWRVHRIDLRRGSHHSILLQRAWDKYGPDAFDFEVLILAPVWMLDDLEQSYLDDQETSHFNIAKDAQAVRRGRPHTEETKAKIGDAKRGRKHTAEARAKISATQIGRKMPPKSAETLARMSAAQKSSPPRKQTPESIAKTVAARRANGSYKLSAEHIAKMTSPEAIAKRIATREADGSHTHTPEARAKISAAGIGRKPTHEARANMSRAQRGKKMSPESIAKTVAARRANGSYNKPKR